MTKGEYCRARNNRKKHLLYHCRAYEIQHQFRHENMIDWCGTFYAVILYLKKAFAVKKFNLALVWKCEIMFNYSFSCRKKQK